MILPTFRLIWNFHIVRYVKNNHLFIRVFEGWNCAVICSLSKSSNSFNCISRIKKKLWHTFKFIILYKKYPNRQWFIEVYLYKCKSANRIIIIIKFAISREYLCNCFGFAPKCRQRFIKLPLLIKNLIIIFEIFKQSKCILFFNRVTNFLIQKFYIKN